MAVLAQINGLLVFQWLTVFMGVVATIYPTGWAVFFFSKGKARIARVLAYMLTGEAISMAVATWFAAYSVLGTYAVMSPVEVMVLRWIIFMTGFLSTLHLTLYIAQKWRGIEV